jgi:hypothetical protein
MKQLFAIENSKFSVLGLPFYGGGELYKLIKEHQLTEKSEDLKFYAANVLIGL